MLDRDVSAIPKPISYPPSIFIMCFARLSLISVCLGTG